MIRYVVMISGSCTEKPWEEYSGVQHKTKREAMHELAVARTDRSVNSSIMVQREILTSGNSKGMKFDKYLDETFGRVKE